MRNYVHMFGEYPRTTILWSMLFVSTSVIAGTNPVPSEGQAVAVSKMQQQSKKVTISGVVTDAKGESIIGASIADKNNPGTGTITNMNGEYTLTVAENTELTISYIGYNTITVKVVPGKTKYDIKLEENSHELDEVVVVGYGVQKKESLTGAMATLKQEKLTVYM